MSDATVMKQACLDLSNAALALFDSFDEHGMEAVWENGLPPLMEVRAAYTLLVQTTRMQAAQRLLALGVPPEELLRMEEQLSGS